MTCKQARQLLAASRRGDCSPREDAELRAHLAGCEGCRTRDVEYQQVGEMIRSLPEIAPPPDFLARVLAAARAEEGQAAQGAAAEKAPETVVVPGLTDASYFPRLRKAVAERRVRVVPLRGQMSPSAAFALRYGAAMAAAFLLFSVGISYFLAQLLHSPPVAPPPSCLACKQLLTSDFIPDPSYPLVADAIASEDGHTVVYAARTSDGQWMLEALTEPSRRSAALLPAPVSGPIVLKGWARGWVLWSQGDTMQGERWTLNATQMLPALAGATTTLHLAEGGHAVAGPVALHGVRASGTLVLVAEEMADGHGQLLELDLRQISAVKPVVIASAQPEHVIADPTTDGASVYWVDEWHDFEGTLHGDIYRLMPDSQPVQVTTNGASFSPMIVMNKLIWLEVPTALTEAQAADLSSSTVTPTPTGTLTPVGGSASTAPLLGALWVEDLDGRADLDGGAKKQITPTAFDPEAGATFVAWQDGNGSYALYDVTKDITQALNTYITDPLVFSVSPKAVLWVTVEAKAPDTQTPVKTTINLLAWPQK
jgi:hypothetical protein